MARYVPEVRVQRHSPTDRHVTSVVQAIHTITPATLNVQMST